jgi:prefoldin beta subunit
MLACHGVDKGLPLYGGVMVVSKQMQQQVVQYQGLQQQFQVLLVQKQRLDTEKKIIEKSLEELGKAKGKVYRAIGPILIESVPADVKKDLTKAVEDISVRLDSLVKHETKLKSRLTELETELRGSTEAGEGSGEGTTVEEAT